MDTDRNMRQQFPTSVDSFPLWCISIFPYFLVLFYDYLYSHICGDFCQFDGFVGVISFVNPFESGALC